MQSFVRIDYAFRYAGMVDIGDVSDFSLSVAALRFLFTTDPSANLEIKRATFVLRRRTSQ